MKHKNSHLLVGYWSRLRRGRALPDQTDVDPRAIKRMLPYVFILDAADLDRPLYRLAGTSLCERYGRELKATNFLAHWESQSRAALTSLLRQSLRLKQPVCISSIAATSECGMVELETVIAPVSFGPGEPTRFLGLVQVMSDATPLVGRVIAFERLVTSQLVREGEPLGAFDDPPLPPPSETAKSHPKAPYLRLVVNRDKPATLHFEGEDLLKRMFDVFGAANDPDGQRVG
jgi:hypothetical protein